MDRQLIIDRFLEAGVLVKGHFLMTSGRHSDMLLQIAQAFGHHECSEMLARELAERFRNERVDLVIGPALGGVILSYEVGRQLGVASVYCERENGRMVLRRGFAIKRKQRVLIVEDVVTTGASLNETIELVADKGGIVVGIGVVVDRTLGVVDFGVRLERIVEIDIAAYPADECPLCEANIPLSKQSTSGRGKK
jgi:orotate phosphoribosyltransferase